MTGGTAPAGLAVLALVFVVVVLLVRWVATPVAVRGRHRGARRPLVPAGLAPQRFVWCEPCGVETAATVHGVLGHGAQVVRCTEGHILHGGAR
jgi:hypothetical protein